MVHKIVAVAAFYAKMISIDWSLLCGCDADDLVIFDIQFELAAYTTKGTSGHDFLNLVDASVTIGHLIGEGTSRAVGCASSAGFTARIEHISIGPGYGMGFETAFRHRPHEASLDFGASPNAACALDTPVQIHPHEWVGIAVSGVPCAFAAPLGSYHLVFICQIL